MPNETIERTTFVECRAFVATELRVQKDGNKMPMLVGYAARFNELSVDLGGFVERIDPVAFDWTLSQKPDVRALIDHDSSLILGRTTSGTLRLNTDKKGLKIEVDMPETTYARDLLVSLERMDISQMSFGFRMIEDGWDFTDPNKPVRTLRKLDLEDGDISAVTFAAYPTTSVIARALERAKAGDVANPAAEWAKMKAQIAAMRGK